MMINIDVGEDAELCANGMQRQMLRYVTHANVACGAHAGDAHIMRETMRMAKALGVHVGAHPGYADREHFGRRAMQLTQAVFERDLKIQLITLLNIAQDENIEVTHVKAHGAMYHAIAIDHAMASSFQECVVEVFGRALPIVLPLACSTTHVFQTHNVWREAFADRRTRHDGTLVPRTEHNAVLSLEEAIACSRALLNDPRVDTLCVHADTTSALEILEAISHLCKVAPM